MISSGCLLRLSRRLVVDIPIYLSHCVRPPNLNVPQTTIELMRQWGLDANLVKADRRPILATDAYCDTFSDAPDAGEEASSIDRAWVFGEKAGCRVM